MNINYTAFPKPTAQFWNEDVELGSDSRVHIQVTEEFVSIIVKKAVRSDAGQYRLRLTNDAGYDTATFNVTVLDRYSHNPTLHISTLGRPDFWRIHQSPFFGILGNWVLFELY